jgi:D-beta-D-heptose 7-phosphate kinase/D-beta-D-heptose 1-phosphate adenosyltransferase
MQKIRTFDKIVTLSDLKYIKRIALSSHLRIACATGCFDILHAGHVRFLEKAKNASEILIVGVVHDAAYRILKGREPVVHQDDRIYTVSRLVCTNHAVFFGEEEELILHLQPDIVIISPTSPPERIADKERLAQRCNAKTLVIEEQSPVHSTVLRSRLKAS